MVPEMFFLQNSFFRGSNSKNNIENEAQCQKNRFESFDFTFSFELVNLVKSNVERLL